VIAEPVAGLVVLVRVQVVVEEPGGSPGTARAVDEPSALVRFAGPETPDPALRPLLAPEIRIEMAVRVERRDDLVSVPDTALRELATAREMQRDTGQHGHLPN
jgi:hypothetical protein